ncbi:RusA family crossover junction endodeoxyribonuclease [Leptobacterium flavescens]|uniref:RusA family crossover junction endodeoxyribonuclease n=1 Tax=Leptobacterium flavescens TaxID=472055 RepID=A0A6P0UKQ6_9FLAO|nr:RusA family crossover junction endodeoxyribonuclease [Leptobacterium flavescens]NER13547.1 RusA family crossover junction endodeoxyribonuclease [Leptobacterium flavescens]
MTQTDKTYKQNPKLNLLFGFYGSKVPTKQDKFKPLEGVVYDEENDTVLDNIYVKKPVSDAVESFNKVMEDIITNKYESFFFEKPKEIEVVLSISCNKRRFYEVDVDNLAKCVLDSLKGLLFEDDSQVTGLICYKHVNDKGMNSILIGITELSPKNKGFIGDISLFSEV